MNLYMKTICLLSFVALFVSNALPQSGLINHPVKKAATKTVSTKPKPAPKVAPAPPPKVVMYGYSDYKGEVLTVNEWLGRVMGRRELQRR